MKSGCVTCKICSILNQQPTCCSVFQGWSLVVCSKSYIYYIWGTEDSSVCLWLRFGVGIFHRTVFLVQLSYLEVAFRSEQRPAAQSLILTAWVFASGLLWLWLVVSSVGNARLLRVSVGFTSGNVPHGRSVSCLQQSVAGNQLNLSLWTERRGRACIWQLRVSQPPGCLVCISLSLVRQAGLWSLPWHPGWNLL